VILLLVLLVLLFVGVPLFVILGMAGLVAFGAYVENYDTFFSLDLLARKMAELTQQNVFLAIPFFVVSGSVMSAGGIARRLVALALALVGHLRGGMAIASIGACVIFASLSGSSPVTLIAIGGLMYPAMVKAGYESRFALGLVTTAGSLGCLVPPSVPMLIYSISVSGGSSRVDVRELFMSGIGAAVVICAMLAVYAWFKSGKVTIEYTFSFARVKTAFREGIWALLLPVIILGGIYSGVFTATEAASVSVVYALFVEFVIHRELQAKDLPRIILDAVQSMGALVMIIMMSLLLNQFMVEKQLGEAVLAWIQSKGLGPVGFMMAMNVFLVVTGMLMDSISAIVLFTPLIVPAAVALGLDPLHVGVVFIVNMEIGYLAPPIATNLFVSASIFKKPFGEVTRAVLPTLALMCVGLLLVTYIPTISTGSVYALKGESFVRPFVVTADTNPAPTADAPAKVQSIEEMMKAAKQPPASPPPPHIMTIEEMMKAAKAAPPTAGTAP
jgi:C4-dicarboxylate transporter DctM subunit